MPFVQQRRGTKAALQAANEIPLDGQIVIEDQPEGGFRIKVGNGTTSYTSLNYWMASLGELEDVTAFQGPVGNDGKVLVRGVNGLFYENNVAQAQMGSPPLGGYSAGTLGAELAGKLSTLAAGSVSTDKIADGSVNNSKLADSAVSMEKMQNNSVITGAIQNSAVTADKLATDSVTAAKVADNAITTTKITDGNVTSQKIASNAVTADKIHPGVVSEAKIADDAVTTAKIAANAVTNSEIAANTILTGNIAAGAINTQSITNDAVTYAKMQNVGAGKVLGNPQTTAGSVEEINSTIFGRSLLNVADASALATTLGAATTADITTAIDNLIDSAPGALNTLNELAAAVADDASFSTTVTNSIATKLPLAGGTITGDVDMQRSASSATKIDWGNSNGGNFSNAATDLDYIRLYTSGSTYAGMGITSSNFNIGTNGAINFTVYAGGHHHATFKSNGLTEFERPVEFKSNINAATRIEVPRADSPGTPKIVSEYNGSVDTDTGIYFPAGDNVAISCGGDRKIDITKNQITVDRKGGYPTLKSSPNGVDGAAGGWMIIDSVTNPCSLNYYSGADVQLAYGGGGATVGTVALGSYKFRVHGGQSHFSHDVILGSGAVYSPVYRAQTTGSLTNNAYSFSNDGDTGMYSPAADMVALTAGGDEIIRCSSAGITTNNVFTTSNAIQCTTGSVSSCAIQQTSDGNTGIIWPAADKLGLVAGGVEFLRGATTSGTTVVSCSHLIDTTNFIYANGYRAKNAGSAASTAYGRYNDGNTGMYFPADNEVAISAGGGTMMSFASGNVEVSQHFRIPDGTNALPGIAFGSDTNTGIYKVAADRIGIVTGGAARFQIGDTGTASLGSTPQAAYKFYSVATVTDFASSQNGVFSGTHTITDASTHHTIGVNGSSYRTFTTDNITNSSYNRAGHFAATTRTQTGVVAGQTIGVYALANHDNSTAGSTSLVGVQGLCYQSSHGSTAPTAYGIFGRAAIVDGDANSSITSAYGLYGDVVKSGNGVNGTITNGYGLYLGDINATNKYGVYQLDTEATNVFQGVTQFKSTSGSAGSYLPGISFIGDGNTGIGRTVADVVDVVCGGNIVGAFGPSGIRLIDGTASEPSFAFASDTDTGIKRNTNGNMDLQHGGSNKISVTSAGSSLGGTVTFSGNVSDGTTTIAAEELVSLSGYGANLLYG